MAKDNTTKKRNARLYKPEMAPGREFHENSAIEGVFQNAKQTRIRDRQTGEDKDVWIYTFRDEQGRKFALFGAFQLDLAFEEVFEKEGGIERCAGLAMKIERGEDSKLPGKRTMGNYQISVWED